MNPLTFLKDLFYSLATPKPSFPLQFVSKEISEYLTYIEKDVARYGIREIHNGNIVTRNDITLTSLPNAPTLHHWRKSATPSPVQPCLMRLQRSGLDLFYVRHKYGHVLLLGFNEGDEQMLLRGTTFLKKRESPAIHRTAPSIPFHRA